MTDVSEARGCLCMQESALAYRLPSPSPHGSVDHRGPLTSMWPHSNSNTAGSFIDSEDPTITARLFNAKSRLTSWPHLAPAFCGQRKIEVDVSWSCFSQLMMWNNIGITCRVKHQQIHFCSAVLIATYKQRNYSCPNSSSYTLCCCAL